MREKIIMASTHVDRHGDVLEKVALENAVVQLNGDKKLKWTVNHRRDFPPIGILSNAEVIEKDNHYYLTAETEKYANRMDASWDRNLLVESFDFSVIFRDIDDSPSENTSISIDKNDFASYEVFEAVSKEIYQLTNGDIKPEMHARKSAVNVPELVITISKYSFIYLMVHPFLKKFSEKIAEDSYEEAKKHFKAFKQNIGKAIRLVRSKAINKEDTLVTIFEIPGTPFIELFAKTDDAELVVKAISDKKLEAIRSEIELLSEKVEIAKVQFTLNPKGKWVFNYLITTDGKSIGTKAVFKKRDNLLNRIILNNQKVTK